MMNVSPCDVQRALRLAEAAHDGQVDRAGRRYFDHVYRVGDALWADGDSESETYLLICAGLLHDILEDTAVTADTLRAEFPAEVVALVETLTHREGEPYDAYIERIAADRLAALVKQADLADNMDLTRLAMMTEADWERTRKYHAAWHRLADA